MADTVTLTQAALIAIRDREYQDGYTMGRVAERLGIGVDPEPKATGTDGKPMGVRPHLTIVPTDEQTAEVFHLPTGKTAS